MTKQKEERKFLHDIASPLGTALFVLDMLIENMKSRADHIADELKQAELIFETLNSIKKKLEERRETLIESEQNKS